MNSTNKSGFDRSIYNYGKTSNDFVAQKMSEARKLKDLGSNLKNINKKNLMGVSNKLFQWNHHKLNRTTEGFKGELSEPAKSTIDLYGDSDVPFYLDLWCKGKTIELTRPNSPELKNLNSHIAPKRIQKLAQTSLNFTVHNAGAYQNCGQRERTRSSRKRT